MSETTTPDLATVITAAIRAGLKNARVALPARVESYDAATQQVTVQPLVQEGFLDETGTRQVERLPVVAGVPVVFPGSGAFRVTFPIAVGDTMLLVFASSSIDRWLAIGGEVDPQDDRRHNISDAIAIPGMFDFAHVPTAAPTNALVLHAAATLLGDPAAVDPIARKSDLALLAAAFSSWTPVAGDGGAALKALLTTLISTNSWPVCPSTVKAL